MSFGALLLVGLAMSADAFAAAISKGALLRAPGLLTALRIGLIFAVIETVTPLVGWFIGRTALSFISAWDHWVAFTLLGALGLNMLRQAIWCCDDNEKGRSDKAAGSHADDHDEREKQMDISLLLLAFATSVDAMAMGVSLSMLSVSIVAAASVIGSCTLVMATLGVLLGKLLGRCGGRLIEALGGLLLIGMGGSILLQHLSAV